MDCIYCVKNCILVKDLSRNSSVYYIICSHNVTTGKSTERRKASEFRARHSLHSLHLDLSLPCSQMDVPPHSLHTDLCLPCSQMDAPPHSLHLCLSLPCSQMDAPPHSLHTDLCLPCSQI